MCVLWETLQARTEEMAGGAFIPSKAISEEALLRIPSDFEPYRRTRRAKNSVVSGAVDSASG